jgi:hypothetical protein
VELPEVEVMRRDLERDVVGKKIKDVDVKASKNAMRVIRRHKTRKEFTSRLAGRKITKVERRGKYILMHLDGGDVLVVHFGMSGQLQRANGRVALPPHTHVVFTFQQGGDLRYVDPRTFGELFVASTDELGKVKRVIEKQSPIDEVLLVLDATTGQNGLRQAEVFGEAVNVTGIVLTKLDGTAKGGIVVSVQRKLGVPVKLVGLGEGPDDLAPFDPEAFVDALID